MASTISDDMKKRLQAQRERQSRGTITVVEKQRKIHDKGVEQKEAKAVKKRVKEEIKQRAEDKSNFFALTDKDLKMRAQEEEDMRKYLGLILKEDYTPFFDGKENIRSTKALKADKWKRLTKQQKREAILEYIMNDRSALYGRHQFVNKFIQIPYALQDIFMEDYLKQPKNYMEYFIIWQTRKDILAEMTEALQKFEEVSGTREEDGPEEISEENVEEDVDLGQSEELLREQLRDKQENDTEKILEMTENIKEKIIEKIHKRARRKAQGKLGITPDVLGEEWYRLGSKKFFKVASDIGIKDSDKLSPENLASKISKVLFRDVKKLGLKKSEDLLDYDNLEISIPQFHLKASEISIPEKLQTDYPEEIADKQKNLLARKLSRITGTDRQELLKLDLKSLQKMYQEMEKEDVILEEAKESLARLSGQDSDDYENAEEVFRGLDKYKKKSLGILNTAECLERYKKFSWLPILVQDVWISQGISHDLDLEEYADLDTELNIKGIGKFYRVNNRFFSLMCNPVYKKSQKGEYLVFESPQKSIEFVVGFTGKKKSQRDKSIPLIKSTVFGETVYFVQQDEHIFDLEKQEEKNSRKNKEQDIDILLGGKVTNLALQVASHYLSERLKEIAPENSDYGKDMPYIQGAIASIQITDQTIYNLFDKVADLTSYLRLSENVPFFRKIAKEYYLPEALMNLTPEEKYALLETAETKNQEQMLSYISSLKNHAVREMGNTLYSMLNPTEKRIIDPFSRIAPPLYGKKSVLYSDNFDGKIYRFNPKTLAKQFSQGNYVNSETNRVFSDNFINLYQVSYIDEGKTYTFPYKQLLDQFSEGNFIIPDTERKFDRTFSEGILHGNIQGKFKKVDYRVLVCQNPEDVENIPSGDIIHYKDPEDGKVYCFPIKDLVPKISKKMINQHTGKKFSEKFVKYLRKIYNMEKILEEEKKKDDENKVPELIESEKLVVPNLYDLLEENLGLASGMGFRRSVIHQREDSDEESYEDSDEESYEDSDEESYEDSDDDSGEEISQEIEKKKEQIQPITPISSSVVADAPSSVVADAPPILTQPQTQCTECKNQDMNFHSVIIQDEKAKILDFCCISCMEKYNFPKVKKGLKLQECAKQA